MTRLRSRFFAFVTLAAAAFASAVAPAFAQNVITPRPGYRVPSQPQQPPPVQQPPVTGLQGGEVQGGIRYPRFTVHAMDFTVVNESNVALGSDEVFWVFDTSLGNMVTRSWSVDTDDHPRFPRGQNCIWPAYDPDASANHSWRCREGGGRGPITFRLAAYEVDYSLYPNRCFTDPGTDVGFFACLDTPGVVLFNHTFTYETSAILARIRGPCRCFEETAVYRASGRFTSLEYRVRFRITRVDRDGEPPAAEINPDGGGTGPVVLVSGALTAQTGQDFEFDAGTVVAAGGDFAFNRMGLVNPTFTLTPRNNAKIWLGNATARGYATCFAQRMSANYVTTAVTVPAAGAYACYVTSDGRVGELRISTLTPSGGGGSLALSYTTWQ